MKRAFSRQKDHRELMLRNLATSLVLYERVDTTESKTKELKSFVDHLLAQSKKADLTTVRNLNRVFLDKNAVKKVIEVLIPRYSGRASGFTRTFGLQNRAGDNAPMMRIELIDRKVFIDDSIKKAVKAEKVSETKSDLTKKEPVKKEKKNDK